MQQLCMPTWLDRGVYRAAERWTTLTKLDAADIKPAKAASTSAGADSQLHISRMFDSPERGFPTGER